MKARKCIRVLLTVLLFVLLSMGCAKAGHLDEKTSNGGEYLANVLSGEISEMKKNSKGVRGIKLERDDELEHLYLVDEDGTILYKKKEVQLNRLKIAKRDGKGTKVRLS